ncbi:MAG: NAD(P)/FAD-dependent oxidoreductase, partial [Nitrospira sp.]|nr:NAD(P)/FAD-dependent oxidoreductase [Nitrospira sp.]MCA9451887.1 NAD(P)/FAD-dependent oxidoreductase [Nitrospira sp.]
MSKKVIILGGGIGGMSAAHELAERGFDVEVFERQEI